MAITITQKKEYDINTDAITPEDRLIILLKSETGGTEELYARPELDEEESVFWCLDGDYPLGLLPDGWVGEQCRALIRDMGPYGINDNGLIAFWKTQRLSPDEHLDDMLASFAKGQLGIASDRYDDEWNLGVSLGYRPVIVLPRPLVLAPRRRKKSTNAIFLTMYGRITLPYTIGRLIATTKDKLELRYSSRKP
jgi:hypothetical protein